jgi:DNA-binding transcriptional MerR regulator
MGTYTIGMLARSANVNVETIRYYERRGLLEQPARGDGYRQYSDDDLARLRFVRRAKELGFTLSEIRELVGTEDRSADEVLAAARTKLAAVEADVARLEVLRGRLQELVRLCEDGSGGCVRLDPDGA